MPFNPDGTFDPLPPPIFPAIPGTVIRSDYYNQQIQDICDGLGEIGQDPFFITYPALAAPDGASLTGFVQDGTGAIAMTVEDKLRQTIDVEDFGAISDAAPTYSSAFVYTGCAGTDNTTAFLRAATAANAQGKGLYLKPNGKYYLAGGFNLPSPEMPIFGFGAEIFGPGPATAVDGIRGALFRQGDDVDLVQRVRRQCMQLPDIIGFRHPIDLLNCAFMDLIIDKIKDCASFGRMRVTADAGGYAVDRRFCVQNRIYIKTMAVNCYLGFVKEIDAMSNQGIQGCEFNCKYASGSGTFITNTYTTSGGFAANTCIDYFNSYISPIVDGNGGTAATKKVIVSNLPLLNSLNYIFGEFAPINMTSLPTMFTNVEGDQIIARLGNFQGNNLKVWALPGFLPGGLETTVRPGFDLLEIYVDAAAGAGGDGRLATPFNTITEAIDMLRPLNLRGTTALIHLTGSFFEALSYDSRRLYAGNCQVIFRGDLATPTNVVIYGLIDIAGPQTVVLQGLAVAAAGFRARNGADVLLANMAFGGVTGAHIQCDSGSMVEMGTNWSVDGNAPIAHVHCTLGGKFRAASRVCNVISGTIGDFMRAQGSGSAIEVVGTTYTGVPSTGRKYTITDNASLVSGGATIPGTVAGVLANGGTYS